MSQVWVYSVVGLQWRKGYVVVRNYLFSKLTIMRIIKWRYPAELPEIWTEQFYLSNCCKRWSISFKSSSVMPESKQVTKHRSLTTGTVARMCRIFGSVWQGWIPCRCAWFVPRNWSLLDLIGGVFCRISTFWSKFGAVATERAICNKRFGKSKNF